MQSLASTDILDWALILTGAAVKQEMILVPK